jgi:hypothetical protein
MKMKTPMQLKIDEEIFNRIKRLARLQAIKEDKDISWQDLVREALDYYVLKESKEEIEKMKND